MILKIVPDTFSICNNVNALLAQQSWPHPRQNVCSMAGLAMAPADRVTALLARISVCLPLWCTRTPVAFLPSNKMRSAKVRLNGFTRPVFGLAADRHWQQTSGGLSRRSYLQVQRLPDDSRYNLVWRYSQLVWSPQQKRDATGCRAALL